MKKLFFIHGKPSDGESTAQNLCDGLEEQIQDDFFRSSTKPSDSPCFVYEIRQWKGSLYSIYSYYHDGRDYGGRENGYCVLTLLVEKYYCYKVADIYRLMEKVYNDDLKRSLGYIDDSGKFLISSFMGEESWEKLNHLGNDVFLRLDVATFRIIDGDFTISGVENPTRFNPKDVDSETFLDILRHDGKIYISKNYPTFLQRLETDDSVKNLQMEKKRLEQKVDSLTCENDNLRQQQERSGHKKPSELSPRPSSEFDKNWMSEIKSLLGRILEQVRDEKEEKIVPTYRNSLFNQILAFFSNYKLIILLLINSFLLCTCLAGIFRENISRVYGSKPLGNVETRDTISIEKDNFSMCQINSNINFLKEVFIHKMFENAKNKDNQNIDVKGDFPFKVSKKCGLALTDPSLIQNLDSCLGNWEIKDEGDTDAKATIVEGDSINFKQKGSVTICYVYGGIRVLERVIEVKE